MFLCSFCESIPAQTLRHDVDNNGTGWLTLYQHEFREAGFLSLESSIQADCYFCKQFWDSLSNDHMRVLQSPAFTAIVVCIYWNPKEKRYTTLHFVLGPEFDDCEADIVDTFIVVPGHDLTKAEDFPDNTADTVRCDGIVNRWIKSCATEHGEKCHSAQLTSWLPARLIDIGDCLSNGPLRLILAEHLQADQISYVALSYFLEGNETLTLTTSNLNTLMDEIPSGDLNRVFADAIDVTRSLGLRYLWIGPLCVLHEPLEQHREELRQVSMVYEHCTLHIAASGAQSVLDGLFTDRTLSSVCSYPWDLSTENQLTAIHAVREGIWNSELRDSCLAQHGGFFENHYLASRTIYFGKDQVYWHCGGLRACETFPSGVPDRLLQEVDTYQPRVLEDRIRAHVPSPCNGKGEAIRPTYDAWAKAVESYSQCVLPDSQNRLDCLSGLAAHFGNLQNQYAAGLWRNNFLEGLLWYVDGPFNKGLPPSHRPLEYRGPSWSWASIDGAVKHIPSSELVAKCAQVLRIQTFPDHRDAAASLRGAFIWLKGLLIKISKPKYFCLQAPQICGCFYPDDRDDIMDPYYFCMPLQKLKSAKGVFLYGLVLRQMRHHWGWIYQRVGIFRCGQGDSLQLLGQKKYGPSSYVPPANATEENYGVPFQTVITII
ncbi:hypothetical protein BDV96DRAFT_89305 [Lophiotrema nucula]|uniref:Heterokaryon incompatibility domain-containing protein n=1 Tax=Lophiotrema nucula TaxID=690887 RepID=A0A6A5Z647_9PLEO|nr:hypothetical protein BDV96DRAFT_89305 [Lophiotrema nucula]